MKTILRLTVAVVLVGALLIPATMALAVPLITVAADIRPASCPNRLNVGSKGVVSVAILGTEDFDVNEVDPSTVLLEGVDPLRWDWEDVGTPFEGELCDCHELGADGYLDLTLKFATQEVVDALGDLDDGEVVELWLTGTRYDGAVIGGSDCVVIKAPSMD